MSVARRGSYFLISGILIGLCCGFLGLFAGKIAIRSVVDELFREATGCRVEMEGVSILPQELRAKAFNSRVVCDGRPVIELPEASASVNLRALFSKQLELELVLSGGMIDGFNNESVLYRFIEYLLETPPSKPGMWRVFVPKLYVKNATVIQELKDFTFRAEGVELELRDQEPQPVELVASISSSSLLNRNEESKFPAEIDFGTASAKMLADRGSFTFSELIIGRGRSRLDAQLKIQTKDQNKIEGQYHSKLWLGEWGLDEYFLGGLQLDGTIGGTLEAVEIRGQLERQSGLKLRRISKAFPSFLLEELSSSYNIKYQEKAFSAQLEKGVISGPGVRLSFDQPISFSEADFSGKASLRFSKFAYAEFDVPEAMAELAFSGQYSSPVIELDATAEKFIFSGLALVKAKLDALLKEEKLSFKLSTPDLYRGSAMVDGELLLSSLKEARFSAGKYSLSSMEFPLASNQQTNGKSLLRVSAEGTFDGELSSLGINSAGTFVSSLEGMPLKESVAGNITVDGGRLKFLAKNQQDSLKLGGVLELEEREFQLELEVENYDLSGIVSRADCLSLTATADYTFSLGAVFKGLGGVYPQALQIGCGSGSLRLREPEVLPVRDGLLRIPPTHLVGDGYGVEISGAWSLGGEGELSLVGNFSMELLLPYLSQIDDLDGNVTVEARVKNDKKGLLIGGQARLTEGELTVESANLDVQDLEGVVFFSPEEVVVQRVAGRLNGGTLELSGRLDPDKIERSEISAMFDRVEIYPGENAYAILSGNLSLAAPRSTAISVTGEVVVVEAEIEQEIGSAEIIRMLLDTLLSLERKAKSRAIEGPSLGDVLLDVKLSANGGIYLKSNWGAAELRSDLRVSGPGDKPQITGVMESLTGWFGFQNRRFGISSGRVIFSPGSSEPRLELYAHTVVRTPNAELVQIYLEARGPVNDPKVILSSDFGYSEQELLSLIAFSDDAIDADSESFVSVGIISNEGEKKGVFLRGVRKFVRTITQLDSLTLEPNYDELSGVVEPKLVARKKLTDSINLRLEQLYGQKTSGSLVGLDYRITPKVTLSGRLEPATDQKEGSAGIDATLSIESESFGFLMIEVRGNDDISSSSISKALQIGARSVLDLDELPRLEKELSRFYRKQGYYSTEVRAECNTTSKICQEVLLHVTEGPVSSVGGYVISGRLQNQREELERQLSGIKGAIASQRNLEELRLKMLQYLRKNSFLQARVKIKYQDKPGSSEKIVSAEVELKKKVEFTISGNEFYTSDELLSKTRVFDRELPFGRNSIVLLAEEIKSLYLAAGFPEAEVSFKTQHNRSQPSDPAQVEREDYEIVIEEGPRVKVAEVRIEGNSFFSTKKIKNMLSEVDADLLKSFFQPDFLELARAKLHAGYLAKFYKEAGFLESKVTPQIKTQDGAAGVFIVYQIEEGTRTLFEGVEVLGFPDDIPLPPLEDAALTTFAIDDYHALLERRLRDYGVIEPRIGLSSSAGGRVIFSVNPGVRAKISAVEVLGRGYSRESVIRKNILLKPGDYWTGEKIRESRGQLLRLGLFSRVEISPKDGKLDSASEVLQVRLFEREPRTSSIGAGYDSVDGIRLFGEVTDRSLLADGRSLSLRLDSFYSPQQSAISRGIASVRYTDPYAFDGNFRWTEDLRFLRLENDNLPFNTDRTSLGSYLDRKITSRTELGLGHSIYFEDLRSVSPDVVLGPQDSGNVWLSFLSANLGYTDYDDVLNPSQGFRLSTYTRLSSQFLFSEADYLTLGGRGAFVYTLPFAKTISLANNLHTASSLPYGSTDVIPISQRFFLGGYSTVRGFRENSLGPRGEAGSVQGGDLLVQNNLELRWRFYENFSILTFLDAGTVYLREKSVSAGDLRTSTGFGLRYVSPVGPLGFDFGFPLDRQDDEPSFRFHFSVGTLF